jgi:ABC-type transport system involved in multi-copper enzyme maturation permease subunit
VAGKRASRRVWDNPVLWRETCTWAYGRKVLAIRMAYLVLFVMTAAGLYWSIARGAALGRGDELGTVIPAAAKPLVPFFLVSLVMVNALAVTSITNERDGRSLDLLLVTDLSPKEFVFGKLGGVLWVTKEMVLLPMLLCCLLWFNGGLSLENLMYVLGGLAVMNVFVAMLGVHCGMAYANSRNAVGISMGTVFFLFLGVATCMLMMISFSGSFQTQLAPFLAFILGGGVGLYLSLGARNPSPAIGAASLLLPFATFYAITSFLLNYTLSVFLVTVATYGFTTAAMLMPAIGEFDIAMGRTKTAEEE